MQLLEEALMHIVLTVFGDPLSPDTLTRLQGALTRKLVLPHLAAKVTTEGSALVVGGDRSVVCKAADPIHQPRLRDAIPLIKEVAGDFFGSQSIRVIAR